LSKKRKISLSEDELILALRNKDKIAMEALYDMYSASLFGVISRIIADSAIAEDVLQESFVKFGIRLLGMTQQKGGYLPGW